MKKMRKSLVFTSFVFLYSILFLISVFAQTNPWSAGSSGIEKNAFTNLESVYVKSNSICQPATEVSLYIVENSDTWSGGEDLEDVRGQPQNITLVDSKIPLTKIWENPKAGSYDIVIDCIKNEEYDRGGDMIDDFYKEGFIVTAVAGTGKVAVGEKNIGDHSWMYDSEELRLTNEMLQLSLTAEGEDIKLENITIQASGAGNDAEIDKLEVYIDGNNNGKVDVNEAMIGDSQPAYTEDNGVTTIILDSILTHGNSQNILVVYQMKQTTPLGEHSLSVKSIYSTGESSGSIISFTGLPINSGTKKVLPEKSCFGSLALEFAPSPVTEGSIVMAKISGLTGCQNKTVVLRANPCGSSIQDKIGSCSVGTEGCEISFTALTSQTYHACTDKNEDNDMIDFGEYTFKDLVIVGKPKPAVEVNVTGNVTEEINKTAEEVVAGKNVSRGISGITGGVIGDFAQKLSGAGGLLLILEATLLLIFIVLVVIAFRLKKPRATEKS